MHNVSCRFTRGDICNARLWELALCGVCVYEGEFEHQNIVVGKFLECLQCYN